MKKVLIVDDDVNFCAVISAQLSLNNFNSLSLNCGHTAQAWLSVNQCDLVLTDLRMPNGSGVELISWIINTGRKLNVIAFSGDPSSKKEMFQFCEVIDIPFIAKPFTSDQILELISTQFNKTDLA